MPDSQPQNQPLTNGASTALSNVASVSSQQVQKPQKQGTYQLQKLRGIHHMILRMSAQGMTGVDIAATLGCTEVMVSYTINSELGKQKLEILHGQADITSLDIMGEFAALAPVAVEVVEEILVNPSAKDSDRLNAADKILSAAGFLKRNNVDVSLNLTTGDDLREAKLKARQMGKFLARDRYAPEVSDAIIITDSKESSLNDRRKQ